MIQKYFWYSQKKVLKTMERLKTKNFFLNVPYLLNFVPLLRKSSVDKSGRSLLDLCKVTINDSEIDKVCRYNMCMYCVDTL